MIAGSVILNTSGVNNLRYSLLFCITCLSYWPWDRPLWRRKIYIAQTHTDIFSHDSVTVAFLAHSTCFNQLYWTFKPFDCKSSPWWLRQLASHFCLSEIRARLTRQLFTACCFVISARGLERATHIPSTLIATINWKNHESTVQHLSVECWFLEEKLRQPSSICS